MHNIVLYSARDDPEELAIGRQVTLNVVPFFHTFGVHVIIVTIFYGRTLISLPNFDPHTFLGAIQVRL